MILAHFKIFCYTVGMKTNGRAIILCGIKHCGKSTQGKKISEELKLDFYDTDDLIYDQTGLDARSLYKSQGKEAFMQAELKACQFLQESLKSAAVIATGGGICENQEAVKILKEIGTIVYLEIAEKAAADRIVREAKFLADGSIQNLPAYIANKNPANEKEVRELFHSFYIERTQKYKSLANVTILMQGSSRFKNMKKILRALEALES